MRHLLSGSCFQGPLWSFLRIHPFLLKNLLQNSCSLQLHDFLLPLLVPSSPVSADLRQAFSGRWGQPYCVLPRFTLGGLHDLRPVLVFSSSLEIVLLYWPLCCLSAFPSASPCPKCGVREHRDDRSEATSYHSLFFPPCPAAHLSAALGFIHTQTLMFML